MTTAIYRANNYFISQECFRHRKLHWFKKYISWVTDLRNWVIALNVTHVNKTLIKAPYPLVCNSTQGPLYKTLKVIQNLGLQPLYRFDRTSWLQRILANISNDTVGTMNIKHSNIKYKIWNFWAVEIVTGVLVFYEESNYFIITYEYSQVFQFLSNKVHCKWTENASILI